MRIDIWKGIFRNRYAERNALPVLILLALVVLGSVTYIGLAIAKGDGKARVAAAGRAVDAEDPAGKRSAATGDAAGDASAQAEIAVQETALTGNADEGRKKEEAGPGDGDPRRPVIRYSDDELDLLIRLVAAEACDEPYRGKVAVAAAIVNRVRDGRFPNNVKGVIYERGQYEPLSNGLIWRIEGICSLQPARKATLEALYGADPSGGAITFYNPTKVGWHPYLSRRPHKITIGNHRFVM